MKAAKFKTIEEIMKETGASKEQVMDPDFRLKLLTMQVGHVPTCSKCHHCR